MYAKELNYSYIHAELAKKGVTLRLLWVEYKNTCPNGYQYSQFCFHFQPRRKTLKMYMHQQHVEGERMYVDYSGKKPCIEGTTISMYLNNKRITLHDVKEKEYSFSTDSSHMPPHHKAHYDWNIERIYSNARKVGTHTETLINKIISLRTFPQQGLRPSMGILALGTRYGNDRLETAAEIALKYNIYKTQQIKNILQNGKDLNVEESEMTVENTTQIRGQSYYSQNN